MTTPIKTPDQIKADFIRRGVTLKDWADDHDVSYQTTRDLLNGRIKGRSGHAHKVAVLLGLKDGVIQEVA